MTGREGDGATPDQVACPVCHGRGRMPVVGEEHRPCSMCSGTGRVLWDVAATEPVPWAKPEDSDV